MDFEWSTCYKKISLLQQVNRINTQPIDNVTRYKGSIKTLKMEENFVYSNAEVLLQTVWHKIPSKKEAPFRSHRFPVSSFPSKGLKNWKINKIEEAPLLKDNELLVFQNQVHPDITAGFRYKVKENGTGKKLFAGKGKYLESIGQGYGKRLTFESDGMLENENFFWTDSNKSGYAFAIDALTDGDVFVTKIGNAKLGFACISNVEENQKVISSEILGDEITKRVKVNFGCQITEKIDDDDGKISLKMQGIVTLVKGEKDEKCKVKDIRILNRSGTAVMLEPVNEQ